MLRCKHEHHSGVLLTSGVPVGYTANLRCTLTSSVFTILARGVSAGRFACALAVRFKLGRTPVGSLAQRLSHRIWSTSRFLCPHQRTAGSPQPPRPADRVLRLAAGQRALAGPARG